MDYQEAIKRIEDHMRVHRLREPQAHYINKAFDLAITAMKIQIPQRVVITDWSPSQCPKCDYELSEFQGDGYYSHPDFLKMCPECGQKIFWDRDDRR